ncbi:hypothetical protein LCGC14_1150760 [marine sediment metagenome]|uniref:Uncharacterized protein n=1 Tax=marine sediment metagenome TaxID=412755 RepID=A0A0F9LVJ1_9ZZZZ
MNAIRNYKPKHEPGCCCAVCTTAEFVSRMRTRNEIRHQRCHEILNNPFGFRRKSDQWVEQRPDNGDSYRKATEGEV